MELHSKLYNLYFYLWFNCLYLVSSARLLPKLIGNVKNDNDNKVNGNGAELQDPCACSEMALHIDVLFL